MKHFGLAFALVCVILCVILCVACAEVPQEPTKSSPTPTPTAQATFTPTPVPTPTPWPTPYPKSQHQDVQIYVLMHLWYIPAPEKCPTVGDPALQWLRWLWGDKRSDPCQIVPGAPLWLRDIHSGVYPLTGPYDSRQEEIMRWQIRQAKAGGATGYFVCLPSATPALDYLFDLFFGNEEKHIKGMLQIAHEENFKLVINGGGVTPGRSDTAYWNEYWRTKEFPRHFAAIQAATQQQSPWRDAYGLLNGRPMYGMSYPGDYMSWTQMLEFFDGTEENSRNFHWILTTGSIGGGISISRSLIQEFPNRSRLQCVVGYNFPERGNWWFNPSFVQELKDSNRPELGMVPMTDSYAGYDERPSQSVEAASVYAGRYAPRNGVDTMKTYLETGAGNGAKVIFFQSLNEYGETSVLEASLNISKWRNMGQEPDLFLNEQGNDDPYKYWKVLAAFFGMSWVPPKPPPCSVVDQLMVQYYPNYKGTYCLE